MAPRVSCLLRQGRFASNHLFRRGLNMHTIMTSWLIQPTKAREVASSRVGACLRLVLALINPQQCLMFNASGVQCYLYA